MLANTIKDWLKRYWLWLLLIGAIVIYALSLLLPRSNKKESILTETLEKAQKLKEERANQHQAIVEEMNQRVDELVEIKAISDEDERLKKLAEFANRRAQ